MNVRLNGTDIVTTRLGFGLSKLMRIPHYKDRRQLLETAFDSGIRHFDVARMYGLGAAESELGSFIRSKRDKVIVATKFGIEPSGRVDYLACLQSPIRWVFSKFPNIRTMAVKHAKQSSRLKLFTPEIARKSLETSLRMLNSDYVDIFLLHEPTGEDLISDDLCDCLEALKTQGKIRAFGFSTMASQAAGLTEKHPSLARVVQFDNDAVGRQINRLDFPCHVNLLTFAPLATALPIIENICGSSPQLVEAIAQETGIDLRIRAQRIRFLLAYALDANPNGTVIFATTSVPHLAESADCVSEAFSWRGAVQAAIEKLCAPACIPAATVGPL